jgi:hypothetical protein
MARNNMLIANMKRVQKTIDSILPCVYAGVALTLHRKYGWGYKRINDLFTESQHIWEEAVERGENMAKMCLDETGIDVVGLK